MTKVKQTCKVLLMALLMIVSSLSLVACGPHEHKMCIICGFCEAKDCDNNVTCICGGHVHEPCYYCGKCINHFCPGDEDEKCPDNHYEVTGTEWQQAFNTISNNTNYHFTLTKDYRDYSLTDEVLKEVNVNTDTVRIKNTNNTETYYKFDTDLTKKYVVAADESVSLRGSNDYANLTAFNTELFEQVKWLKNKVNDARTTDKGYYIYLTNVTVNGTTYSSVDASILFINKELEHISYSLTDETSDPAYSLDCNISFGYTNNITLPEYNSTTHTHVYCMHCHKCKDTLCTDTNNVCSGTHGNHMVTAQKWEELVGNLTKSTNYMMDARESGVVNEVEINATSSIYVYDNVTIASNTATSKIAYEYIDGTQYLYQTKDNQLVKAEVPTTSGVYMGSVEVYNIHSFGPIQALKDEYANAVYHAEDGRYSLTVASKDCGDWHPILNDVVTNIVCDIYFTDNKITSMIFKFTTEALGVPSDAYGIVLFDVLDSLDPPTPDVVHTHNLCETCGKCTDSNCLIPDFRCYSAIIPGWEHSQE